MPIEVELKYLASGPDPLARLSRVPRLGSAVLGPPRVVNETDAYLDTADGRLAAARWACRLRERDGVARISLKGPPEMAVADGLHRRPEVEGPAGDGRDPAAWPPSEARELLDRLRAGEALVERLRLRQARTERSVSADGGVGIGTMTLDVVDVEAGGRHGGTLHVVELELAPNAEGGESALVELQAALDRTDGLTRDRQTKLERALDMLGLP